MAGKTYRRNRYIPDIGDHFQAFVLTREVRQSDNDRYKLHIGHSKYYGWPANRASDCICTSKQNYYWGWCIGATDEDGHARDFQRTEFYFVCLSKALK